MLIRVVWQKQLIPKALRRAGGVLIPKEKDTTDIAQLRPICLLNVEGKIFFSIVSQRLPTYLERNKYIDTSVQKAFKNSKILGLLGAYKTDLAPDPSSQE